MYCIQCGFHQSEGKFCATCGTALGSHSIGAVQTMDRVAVRSRARQNDYVEKGKALAVMYGHYFLKYLKQPLEVLKQGEKEFVNAISTTGILSIFVGLAIFSSMKDIESLALAVTGSALALVLISILMVLGSLYATTLLLGPESSIKKLVTIYGTHLIPSTVLLFIANILLLFNANTFGNLLLLCALLFALFIIPLYLLTKLLTQEESMLDPLYGVVVYIVIFSMLSSLCLAFFGDTIVGDMITWWNV